MRRFAILGMPVAHSLSPAMHDAAFAACKIDAMYERLPTTLSALPTRIDLLRSGEYCGFNITAPLKRDVLSYCDEIDEAARLVGAANTLWVRDGKVFATNTDVAGVMNALVECGSLSKMSSALIIGAGGAARAAAIACEQLKLKQVAVAARNVNRTEEFAFSFDVEIASPAHNFDLIVQATPASDSQTFVAEYEKFFKGSKLLLDMVYEPRQTAFMRRAAELGIQTIDGTRMLLHQGAAAFSIWMDREAPIDMMERTLENHID